MKPVKIEGIGTVFEVEDDETQEETQAKVKEYLASRSPNLPRVEEPTAEAPGLLDKILQFGKENALPIAGGLAGGLAGTPVGAGVGAAAKGIPVAGRVLSKLLPFLVRAGASGAGSAAGEAGQAVVEGKPEEAGTRATSGLKSGALSEAVFGGAGGIVRGARKLVPRRGVLEPYITPAGREAIELLGPSGVRPAQVVAGKGAARAVDVLDSMAESSFFGGEIGEHYAGQAKQLDGLVDKFVGTFGKVGTREQAGELLEGLLKREDSAWRTVRRSMFKKADELTQGVPVDAGALKRKATDELAAIARLPKGSIGAERVRLLEEMTQVPDTLTFSEADELLQGWSRMSTLVTDPHPDKTKRVAAIGAGLIEQAMEKAGRTLGPDGLAAYKAARQFSREGAEVFNTKLVRRIVKDLDIPDEKITETLAKTDLKALRAIKGKLGESGFENFRSAFSRRLVDDASPGGEINGKTLNRLLARWGPEKVEAIFGKEQAGQITKLGRVIEEMQKKGVPQGRIFIQLKQAGVIGSSIGALGGVLTGSPELILGSLASGGLFLGGPAVAAKAFTNPKISKYLLEGLQAPSGSKTQTQAIGRAAALLSVYAMQERGTEEAEAGYTPGP